MESEEKTQAVESQENEATQQESAETQESSQDNQEFSASKFIEADLPSGEENQENIEEDSGESQEDGSEEELDLDISWGEQEDEQEESSESNQESQEEQPASFSNSFFESLTESLGTEVKSEDDIKKVIDTLLEQNQALRDVASNAGVTNDKIRKLESFLKLTDEDLVKKDLELNGFSEEEINDALETIQDNGTLKIEALKIRKNLQNYVDQERRAESDAVSQKNAMRDNEAEQQRTELKEYLSKTDTMFGLKMAKDDATLQKAREAHFKYITSGKFFSEITESNQTLAEVSFLWRNRETLFKALKNKGESAGKKAILEKLENPSAKTPVRIMGANDKDFDVNSFLGIS
jgi:hypothetical protein